MAEFIKVTELSDTIALLTIDRPKALNALNAQVLGELAEAIDALGTREDLRALIVTGSGRAFIAGADIKAMQGMSTEQAQAFGRRGHAVMNALAALPCPVLGALGGFTLGGGLELALACDLLYASSKAKLGLPEVGLGLIPGFGGTQRLARLIGPHAAREMVYTGELISAARAKELGIVLEVFEPEELMGAVEAKAKAIASKGPRAVRIAKRVLTEGLDTTLAQGLEGELGAFGELFGHSESQEGMSAHLEKRAPNF